MKLLFVYYNAYLTVIIISIKYDIYSKTFEYQTLYHQNFVHYSERSKLLKVNKCVKREYK